MAGAKSGKAPSGTFAPGGSEVYSDEGRDYFDDRYFSREGSFNQIKQREKDLNQLSNIKKGSSTVPSFCKGGKVIKTWSR